MEKINSRLWECFWEIAWCWKKKFSSPNDTLQEKAIECGFVSVRVFVSKKKKNWSMRWTKKKELRHYNNHTYRICDDVSFGVFGLYAIYNWHCHIQCESHFIQLTIHCECVRAWCILNFGFSVSVDYVCGVECTFALFFSLLFMPFDHCLIAICFVTLIPSPSSSYLPYTCIRMCLYSQCVSLDFSFG